MKHPLVVAAEKWDATEPKFVDGLAEAMRANKCFIDAITVHALMSALGGADPVKSSGSAMMYGMMLGWKMREEQQQAEELERMVTK